MKNQIKRYMSLVLCVVFAFSMTITACAATTNEINTADALNSLGLFLGMDIDEKGNPVYGLDQNLTREQGVMLLLRMLGQEESAKTYVGTHPFVDITNSYYIPFVSYAYNTGLVKGTGVNTFDGSMAMSEQMFATFCMRPLGYQDGADADFLYENAVAFAKEKGVYKTSTNQNFTRGDAVTMFWQVLNATCKNSEKTLADNLIEKGVFTAEAFAKAKDIQKNGKTTDNSGSPISCGENTLPEDVFYDNDTTDGGGTTGGTTTGGGTTGSDTQISECNHTYDSKGICTKCGHSQYELPDDEF